MMSSDENVTGPQGSYYWIFEKHHILENRVRAKTEGTAPAEESFRSEASNKDILAGKKMMNSRQV